MSLLLLALLSTGLAREPLPQSPEDAPTGAPASTPPAEGGAAPSPPIRPPVRPPVQEGEAPGVATPGVEAPGVATPGVEAPGVEAPGVATPGVETPGVEAPGVDAPADEDLPPDGASDSGAQSLDLPPEDPLAEDLPPEDLPPEDPLAEDLPPEDPLAEDLPPEDLPPGSEAAPAAPEPAARPAPLPPVPSAAVRLPPEAAPWPEPERLLPPAPVQSLAGVAGWLALAVLASLLARLADRPKASLARRGLIPGLLRVVSGGGRILALVCLLTATLYAMPSRFGAAVPYILIGAALATGWTARDLLRDVLAGLILSTEGRVAPGRRVRFEGHAGVVEDMGFRSVLIIDDDGVRLTLPNRLLLDRVLATDEDTYAPVEVQVHVPRGAGAGHVRQILEELVLLSPYVAPSRRPHVYRDPDTPDVWVVEARLLDPRYARRFRGALVELADEVLGPGAPRPPQLEE